MPEILDLELKEGTPLEEYLGDARAWIEEADDLQEGDQLHKAVETYNEMRCRALNMANDYDELVRVIQVLVMAGRATWTDIEKAKKLARVLR